MARSLMTQSGYENMHAVLTDLKKNQRHNVADKIRTARGFGDPSENNEYCEAKDEQALIELRITRLQRQMQSVQIIDPCKKQTDVVELGAFVTLLDIAYDEQVKYRLVSDLEAQHITEDAIAATSPVGQAITGARIGDSVVVHLPNGDTGKYKVVRSD